MGYQKYLSELYADIGSKYRSPQHPEVRALFVERKKKWRKGPSVVRASKPTRIDKARKYGFKAKGGFVVARVRIKKGVTGRSRPKKGRRPKRAGQLKITPSKSKQRIAEERAQRRYSNMEVLGSYWLWEDGQYRWFEVVLVDPSLPCIKSDKDVNWVTQKQHRSRVHRGLTPAGRKERGLSRKGVGAEKVRPSIRANKRLLK
ncbi:MAG: 50S ribosomal protein L15e [Candidatus Altiarchaeales archaeon ex4484_96]|nr:MAG: 50S ribosomal protein L15e [Candidatus Altiarchaeales archaeon ex4484_96]